MASTIDLPVKKLSTLDIPFIKPIATILAVNIILTVIILVIRDHIPPVVPLFYGRPRGIEQLAPRSFLLLPPGISIFVIVLNSILIAIIEDRFIKKVLIGIAVATTLLSTITVIKIILLVGSI